MVEVTTSNFISLIPQLEADIRESVFVCMDLEFTGLSTDRVEDITLFNSPEERYGLLKCCCEDFTILQCGLAMFSYDMSTRTYTGKSYNFFLYPRSYKTVDRHFKIHASAFEFLMQYDFDFNKCFYGGITYLNEDEIENVTSQDQAVQVDHIVLNDVKKDFLQKKVSLIKEWLSEGVNGDKETVSCYSRGMCDKLEAALLAQFDNIITTRYRNDLIITMAKSSEREAALVEQARCKEAALNEAIGFTHIFRLLCQHQKPLVGHNLVRDILFLHQKFYRALPDSYAQFKTNIATHFPPIYDTKHVVNNMRVELRSSRKYKELFTDTSLLALYNECVSERIKGMLYQPKIHSNFPVESGMRQHEAGYDAFLAGEVFLRLAHLYSMIHYRSPEMKAFHFKDYLRDFKHFKNCLNMIRCVSTHMCTTGPDPVTIRPQWLKVRTRDGTSISKEHVRTVFSGFGNVDIRVISSSQCLVAPPSVTMAAGLLLCFKEHEVYNVERYTPPGNSWNVNKVYMVAVPQLLIISAGVLYMWWRG